MRYVLLIANIALVYCLTRRLADSRFAALAAALLFAYQQQWAALYFDTGYIFDVLCAFFLFSALLLYLTIRQHASTPRPFEYAALVALFVCALNSKEMAVVLPVSLALYELLWQRRRHFIAAAAMAVMTIAFIAGRTGSLTENPAYKPQFTWARLMETSAHFLDEIFAAHNWFTTAGVLALGVSLLLLAFAARSGP